jgi:gas vesicle protein
MTFDTLAVATELKTSGFTQEQAEALARAWSHVASSDLSTKADLIEAKSELKQEIAGVKSELRQEIAGVKSELKQEIAEVRSDVKTLRWMVGFGLGLSLLILGKLFLIHV